MSKDPAFLFYSSDFLVGTMLMTDEQVGKYIRLLCIQHQSGHIISKDMLKICKRQSDDFNEVVEKFKIDDEGRYYNVRLESETKRRLDFSESRRNNRAIHKNNNDESPSRDKDISNISPSRDKDISNISPSRDKDISNISPSRDKDMLRHDEHMENENENSISISSLEEEKKVLEEKKKVLGKLEDFSFVPESWMELWIHWLNYRAEIKKPFKSKMSLKSNFNLLLSLSDNNLKNAEKIIDQAISNGYQGLFELKTNNKKTNGNDRKPYSSRDTRNAEVVIDELRRSKGIIR